MNEHVLGDKVREINPKGNFGAVKNKLAGELLARVLYSCAGLGRYQKELRGKAFIDEVFEAMVVESGQC